MQRIVNLPLLGTLILFGSLIGISFISATKSRMDWSWGMKLRGHVGVYFTNGRR